MIMLSGEQTAQDSEQNRSVFDQYATQNFTETANFINPDNHFATAAAAAHHNHFHLPFHHPQTQNINTHLTNFYHSHAYGAYGASASSYPHHHHHPYPASMLSLEPAGFLMMPKSEPVVGELDFNDEFSASASRIGLNLGGRTYFASSEDDFVNRLYRRSRILESGSVNSPKCQAEGCKADLTNAKHYHRRHKVCEFHSKAATVLAGGMTQRFCQQCSRFHTLSEFDNGKRSCRKRLADHNRRRRKSQQPNQDKSRLANNALNSSSENLARSPPESEPHSSSVTVAISPPRISLDCFGHKSYNMTNVPTSSTTSTRSSQLFYSNG